MKRYLKVEWSYVCTKSHPNTITKYFLSHSGLSNDQVLMSKVPRTLPCSICPPQDFPSGRVRIGMKVSFLTPEQFSNLGLSGEVEAIDSPIV